MAGRYTDSLRSHATGASSGSTPGLRFRALLALIGFAVLVITAYALADTYVQDPTVQMWFFTILVAGIATIGIAGMAVFRPLIQEHERTRRSFEQEKQELLQEAEERIREVEAYAHEVEQANADLERFAQVASHDLKEPVRMISSYIGLLEERYGDDLDEEAQEYMGYAVDGAHRLRDLIDGLLAYARVGDAEQSFHRVDLDEALDDAIANLQRRIDASDARIDRTDLPVIHGVRPQLSQVFQNLIGNAIKFSGDQDPQIRIWAQRDGDEWTINVQDHGLGFDAEREHRIFDIFQRAHEDQEGQGVGLAVCRRIIDRHRGEIWAEAKPGTGATFRFTLPVPDEEDPSAGPKPRAPPETLGERSREVI